MARPPEGDITVPGQGGGYKSPILQKHIWPHHLHMARLVACGHTPGDICRVTGFSPGQISRIMGSPLFQAEVQRLMEDIDSEAVYEVQQQLASLANRAIEVVSEDLHREVSDEFGRKQRARVAFEVLDRAGYGKQDTSVHQHNHLHLHKDVSKMDDAELVQDVLELSEDD